MPTVVVVDGGAGETSELVATLEAAGARVEVAASVDDVCARLAEWSPSAVVVDLDDRAGALIAALLPRGEGEAKLLRPAGKKLADTARTAAEAAREAGTSRLGELGLTRDAGVETLRSVLSGAGDAARTSAQAALGKVRGGE